MQLDTRDRVGARAAGRRADEQLVLAPGCSTGSANSRTGAGAPMATPSEPSATTSNRVVRAFAESSQ
ncbi:hypothetical protein BJF78_07445 [Pseudonocardia sp. CNS-139]|nr:hypothetical protein BJF78_07445 [Pseudonocardia sp. CNS-139]